MALNSLVSTSEEQAAATQEITAAIESLIEIAAELKRDANELLK